MNAGSASAAAQRRQRHRLAGFAVAFVAAAFIGSCLWAQPAKATPTIGEAASNGIRTLSNAPITIEVTGVRAAKGAVRVAVCTAVTFLKDACPYFASVRAMEGSTFVTVTGIPPGIYAVQLFHDENDNDRVDRGPFGIPTEAIGFSNDAEVGLKGPSFSNAAFTHGEERQTLKVTLRRFGPFSH